MSVARNAFIASEDNDWSKYKELIIVPDGLLWYVPFEVLQLEKQVVVDNPNAGALDPAALNADPDKKKPKKKPRKKKVDLKPDQVVALGEQTSIRYSPTLYLSFGAQRPERVMARTAVMSGRMHPKAEVEQTYEVVEQLLKDIPDAVDYQEKLQIPSGLYGSIIDRFVVLSDLKVPGKGGAFALNPAQLDQGLNGSNLASWLSLPLWAPEYVVLPGYSSAGAAGGRGKGNGQDIFLTSCGLLASGSRSIMLSRWRAGGRNSMELTRGFARRLGTMTPSAALAASIKETKELEIDLEFEPRIKSKKLSAPLKAEHPFFWAGPMVIEVPAFNTGENNLVKDAADEPEQMQPPVNLPPPDQPKAAPADADPDQEMKEGDEADDDPETGGGKREAGSGNREFRRRESGGGSQEAGVRRRESGVRSQESGVRNRESGIGSQESGIGSRSLSAKVSGSSDKNYLKAVVDFARNPSPSEPPTI